VKVLMEAVLDRVLRAGVDTEVDAMELQHISLKEIELARSGHTPAPAARNSLAPIQFAKGRGTSVAR
jgi:hypothetical protein